MNRKNLQRENERIATYKQIQAYVRTEYGFQAKTCWIADVKEQVGLPVRDAWNRAGDDRQEPCPADKIDAIMDAFRYFGMIE